MANPDDPENTAAAERRAELLIRMHGFQAYQAANVAVMRRQADVLPYWQYLSMQDGRVRASHRALEGKVLPADHPFWKDHTPPWEWGCRCQIVPLSPEDVADLEEADKDKLPEERRVLPPEVIAELERTGHLVNGPTAIIDVRSPKEKGQPGAFEWDPQTFTLPMDQIKGRYDAPVWEAFRDWAQSTPPSTNPPPPAAHSAKNTAVARLPPAAISPQYGTGSPAQFMKTNNNEAKSYRMDPATGELIQIPISPEESAARLQRFFETFTTDFRRKSLIPRSQPPRSEPSQEGQNPSTTKS